MFLKFQASYEYCYYYCISAIVVVLVLVLLLLLFGVAAYVWCCRGPGLVAVVGTTAADEHIEN